MSNSRTNDSLFSFGCVFQEEGANSILSSDVLSNYVIWKKADNCILQCLNLPGKSQTCRHGDRTGQISGVRIRVANRKDLNRW